MSEPKKLTPGDLATSLGDVDDVEISVDPRIGYLNQTYFLVKATEKRPHMKATVEARFDFMAGKFAEDQWSIHGFDNKEFWDQVTGVIHAEVDIPSFQRYTYAARVKDKKEQMQNAEKALAQATAAYTNALKKFAEQTKESK